VNRYHVAILAAMLTAVTFGLYMVYSLSQGWTRLNNRIYRRRFEPGKYWTAISIDVFVIAFAIVYALAVWNKSQGR
jgi:hypothetical protein